jgi:CheY-like chemotaxis protein
MKTQQPIMVVEDDEDDQLLLQAIFEQLEVNRDIIYFGDCMEAYSFLTSSAIVPALIISDINLPGTTGVEFKRMIEKKLELQHAAIPFYFFTTAMYTPMLTDLPNVDGYFVKGRSYDQMEAAVISMLAAIRDDRVRQQE